MTDLAALRLPGKAAKAQLAAAAAATARPGLVGMLPWGPVTQARLARTALVHAVLLCLAGLLGTLGTTIATRAFGLGLAAPGAGFLFWAGADSPTQFLAVGLSIATVATFAVSLLVWFATGNALLPPAVWLTAALAAAEGPALGLHSDPASLWPAAVWLLPLGIVVLLAGIGAILIRQAILQSRRNAAGPFSTVGLTGDEPRSAVKPAAARPALHAALCLFAGRAPAMGGRRLSCRPGFARVPRERARTGPGPPRRWPE